MSQNEESSTEQIYKRALELMTSGSTGKAAFAQIAEETGIVVGTVQAAYYRAARKAGTVKRRPRKATAAAKPGKARRPETKATPKVPTQTAAAPEPSAAPASDSIAAKLELAAQLLSEVASEVRVLEADAGRWQGVRQLLNEG